MPPTLRPRTPAGKVKYPISKEAFLAKKKGRITGKEYAARKDQWREDWAIYINSRSGKWAPGTGMDGGKLGFYRLGRKEVLGSDAMRYFDLTKEEIETLPAKEGGWYGYKSLKKLALRKNAMLSGLHTKGLPEDNVLRKGRNFMMDRIKHTRPRLEKPVVRLSEGGDGIFVDVGGLGRKRRRRVGVVRVCVAFRDAQTRTIART